MTLLSSALLNLLWTVAVFVPLERLSGPSNGSPSQDARPSSRARPGRLTDLLFYLGQALLWLPGCAWLLHHLYGPLRDLPSLAPLRSAFDALPDPLQLVLVVVLGDLCAYWGHRLQHAWGPLWRFHAVHHTPRHLDWLAAFREHPLDGLYTQALVNLPAILLGFDLRAWLGLVVFRGAWAILVHSDVEVPLGPLRWLFGAPEFHRAHHALSGDTGHFGNLAPYLDVLFGTHGPSRRPAALGVAEAHPDGWVGLLAWSFRAPSVSAGASASGGGLPPGEPGGGGGRGEGWGGRVAGDGVE